VKVPVWVDLGSREIEVEISGEDAVAAILEPSEGWTPKQLLLRICNNVGGFLRKVPDSLIAELNEAQRKVIAEFFEAQGRRFRQ
jgi:hypothetical protein